MIMLDPPPRVSGKGALEDLRSYIAQMVENLNVDLDEIEGRLKALQDKEEA